MQEQAESVNILSAIANLQSAQEYQELNWEGSLEDYLKLIQENPRVTRNAFQRIFDMILSYGVEEFVEHKKRITRYRFFRDEMHNGRDAVYGIDQSLNHLVDIFKSASRNYGTERRVILLHGPVGSAKSTIVRLLKKGIEDYSHTPGGAMYTFAWTNIANDVEKEVYAIVNDELPCPMREEPLHLIPYGQRERLIEELMRHSSDPKFPVQVDGDLCPACRQMYRELTRRYKGDWFKVMDHVKVRRLVLSEKDRNGIGTFQPKDEKNQDSTELTGDINYRKIAIYGSDSDARAFNFDGEFNVANRGIIEFIEVLKLEVAFLYDLLGASQEHKIKPKKFPQTDIDEVIIGHTNEPEYRKLQNNEFMEALRDRTVKIDIPYITKLNDEIKVYEKDYNSGRIRGKHIAPHTIEMASMWAVLTRLETPKKA
ncbi:MAG TPA: serine protein kinase, partial [Terriglobia bacterium]|nr:serine protein kinase [Terriglobia bacterium]